MSRTKHGLKNIKASSFFLVLNVLLNIISRRFFIEYLGAEVVGLTAVLHNVLGFLNLAELGLTSAVAGVLYKAIYDDDKTKIQEVISIFGYLYRMIGFTILGAGIILSFFLESFFSSTDLSYSYIIIGYYIFLFSNLVGYFISYRQTLLVADQKEYIVTSFTYSAQILKVIVQILCLSVFNLGYYSWLIIELLFGVSYGFVINYTVNKKYPWLKTDYKIGKLKRKEYPELFTTIKQVIPHNIGSFVQNQASNILIYAFASLVSVTLYTNYTLVMVKVVYVINVCFRSLTASIGNFVAEGNNEKIYSLFKQFTSLFYIFAITISITCVYQMEPFVNLWLGDGFLLDKYTFYIMVYIMFIGIIRLPINYFLGAYVLYKDVWAPIIEAGILIILSIVLGARMGLCGVILGSAISLTVIAVLWKPYFLFKEGFKISVKMYWLKNFKYLLIAGPIFIIPSIMYRMGFLMDNTLGIGFLVNSITIALLSLMLYTVIMYYLDKDTRMMIRYIKSLITK